MTVRRREQGLLPSELSRQTNTPSERADLERVRWWPMRYSARPRAPQRDTTSGCPAPISRSRDVAPAPGAAIDDRQAAVMSGKGPRKGNCYFRLHAIPELTSLFGGGLLCPHYAPSYSVNIADAGRWKPQSSNGFSTDWRLPCFFNRSLNASTAKGVQGPTWMLGEPVNIPRQSRGL